jgi:pimeloyl-ACP methyl ester carboxylesterase
MATFILLHGSFHAAWNWHKVLPLLEQAGHQGIAFDLPAHGLDATPARRVTLERSVDAVLARVDALPEKPVLVAHSRSGMLISQAAERRPEGIRGLVYLAAYLVPNGKSMMDYALLDQESLVVQNVVPRLGRKRAARMSELLRRAVFRHLAAGLLPQRRQTHRLDRAAVRAALYHDCPPEITELAHALLEPEPNWPGFTPLELTSGRYGRVPRVYIECLQDRAVTLSLQRQMWAESPCQRVITLDASHSPFFSQPHRLVAALQESLGVFAEHEAAAQRTRGGARAPALRGHQAA